MWSRCTAPLFLTSALTGGERSNSCLCHFTPGNRAPGIYSIEGWVGPKVGLERLDAAEKRTEESDTTGNRTQAIQLIAHHYTTTLQTPGITSGRSMQTNG
jgi:hypothetical protein